MNYFVTLYKSNYSIVLNHITEEEEVSLSQSTIIQTELLEDCGTSHQLTGQFGNLLAANVGVQKKQSGNFVNDSPFATKLHYFFAKNQTVQGFFKHKKKENEISSFFTNKLTTENIEGSTEKETLFQKELNSTQEFTGNFKRIK